MKANLLRDTFHRRINYLRVSVTDRCNLRCVYCMPPEGIDALSHSQILTYEEILRVVRLAVGLGITKVRLTGGEPLVRKGIVGLIHSIAVLPGVSDLSLTTNGTLLGKMAADLKAAGLMRVNISLDTLKPDVFERITGRPELHSVLEGIDAAMAAGLGPVKVNTVAMRGINDGEILDFAELAAKKGLEVRFIEHMPSRRDAWSGGSIVEAGEIIEKIATRYKLEKAHATRDDSGPGRMYRIGEAGRIGVISPMSDHFCGTCNRLRLTSDGRLRSCLFSADELDLKAKLRDGSDDAEIENVLRQAVMKKPEGHGLSGAEGDFCGMEMSRIGG